jgi:fatty acid desaturase
MPTRELRAELRRIPTARNVLTILGVWAQVTIVIGGAIWLSHPLAWAAAFVLMGRNYALMAILGHEASHRLLLPHRKLNDFVGRWLAYYPSFTAYDAYRRVHAAHHREEFGPTEPDMNFYAGYPVGWASMRRKFTRDILGITGAKNLRGLFSALRSPTARPVALRILASQAVIIAVFTAIGRPELYLFLWLLPWLTVWKVFNRLRAIAEHGGMHKSSDRRETTHHVHQSRLPRFWFAPYNTGWHLAHHVDSGVPFRNLPRLQRELEAAGYVPEALIWPSYTALWRAMANGRPAVTAAA